MAIFGLKFPNFFPNFFAKISRVFRENFASFSRFPKVLESSEITEIFPKFEKSQFPKLAKTKISEKNVFRRALSITQGGNSQNF
jgi:hypothetical protein